jgi:heme exporter protein A
MERGVIVDLVGVTKYYGRLRLFKNINVRLEPGRCLAVTGPNGSGKSTFLTSLFSKNSTKRILKLSGGRIIGFLPRASLVV